MYINTKIGRGSDVETLKILITGASGFIGSNIMEYLEGKENNVFGCVRTQEKKKNERYIICDLEKEVLDIDVDIIIHTAGIRSYGNTDFNAFFDGNIIATKNVLEYAKLHNVKRIIFLGSVESYGEANGVLREDSPRNNLNDYGVTKYVAEQLIRNSGIPYYILILPGVVGRSCGGNWIINVAKALYSNKCVTYYNGQGLFNNILDVQDLCAFIEKLITENVNKSETYLLGSSEKVTVENVVRFLKDKFLSASQLYSDNQKRNAFYLDVNKAISDGFSPHPIIDTLDVVYKEVLRRENQADKY